MDYRKFLYYQAQAAEPSYQSNVAPYLTGEQLPPNAIIIQKEDLHQKPKTEDYKLKSDKYQHDMVVKSEPVFAFRRVNQHGNLFTVPYGTEAGVNETARAKILELGLENERFFFQIGNNRFIEATQRLVG